MKRTSAAWIAVAAWLADSRVWACATCFGAPDDPQTNGMNAAILTLLGVTYSLFLVMIGAALVMWRNSRRAAGPDGADGDAAATLDVHHG